MAATAIVTDGTGGATAAVVVGCIVYLLLLAEPRTADFLVCGLLAAAVSLATTGLAWAEPPRDDPNAGWGLVEVAGLLGLIVVLVGRSRTLWEWAAVAALVAGQVLWVTRFVPVRTTAALVGASAAWGLGSLVASAIGAYPRVAARRTARQVASARAQQRRQLERDLHDYVAHDLSGIIVQAQAARYASRDDPEQLLRALERIEDAGQKAMSSMDRALELLRDGEDLDSSGYLGGQPGLAQAGDLVASFRESTPAVVSLDVEGPVERLPRLVSATLVRVLVECLTNVRRHSPASRRVDIGVRVDDHRASITVRNDGAGSPGAGGARAGGTGLAFLATRVEALGGTMLAGAEGGDWRVEGSLPLGHGGHP